jgi:hypothetical protein
MVSHLSIVIKCKEYERARRQTFREEMQRRRGRNVAMVYPEELKQLPKFSEWLQKPVADAAGTKGGPSNDQVEASKLPQRQATGYRAMHAQKMHFRVRSAEEEKVTCNNGVASSISWTCLGRGRGNPVIFR